MQGYVLLRLMKGLGSGRGACRQGFAAALAAVLESKKSISNTQVTELMEQHLPLIGCGKGTVRSPCSTSCQQCFAPFKVQYKWGSEYAQLLQALH